MLKIEWMLMHLNLFSLEIVRAVETRAPLPREALGFSEAERVNSMAGL